jgi:hypothetical protein
MFGANVQTMMMVMMTILDLQAEETWKAGRRFRYSHLSIVLRIPPTLLSTQAYNFLQTEAIQQSKCNGMEDRMSSREHHDMSLTDDEKCNGK